MKRILYFFIYSIFLCLLFNVNTIKGKAEESIPIPNNVENINFFN